MNKIVNLQKITMNNNKLCNKNIEIYDNINSNDEMLFNNMLCSLGLYEKKLILLNNMITKPETIKLVNKKDIINFFNTITPLNIENNLGCKDWSYKTKRKSLFIQNCYSYKHQHTVSIYMNNIKSILDYNNIKYQYFEFRNSRFNKNVDSVFYIN